MKILPTLFLCAVLTVICSTFALAQTKSKKNSSNLKTVVARYGMKNVRALDRETGEKYKVNGKSIFNNDLDGDGDFDAIVEFFFCESQNCHSTTKSSKIAVFLSNKGNYQFVTDRSFLSFNKDGSIDLIGKVNSVDDDKIYVDIYGFATEDAPQCCPEMIRREVFAFRKNKLVKLRE